MKLNLQYYSSRKAEIIRSVLAGSSMQEVAKINEITVGRVGQIIHQVSRRWMRANDVKFVFDIEKLRVHAESINSYVAAHSLDELEKTKKVNQKEGQIKKLNVQLKKATEQIKAKQLKVDTLKLEIDSAEAALKALKLEIESTEATLKTIKPSSVDVSTQ